ncbi:polysaccharide chain length determinant protein [Fibrobacterales bacterium]|nr:polysaccharide chain length determinant protein [Fibrobacterales bacterium]
MSFIDVLFFLLKRKKFFLGVPVLAGILGVALAWILPPYYKSEIRVVLDSGTKSVGISNMLKSFSSSNALSDLAGSGLGGSSGENEDLYLAILDSRDLLLSAIEKFHLDTIYKNKYKETLVKKFYKDLKVEIDNLTGVISCSYETKNKELARDIVSFVVEDANNRYIKLKREKSVQTLMHLRNLRGNASRSVDSLSQILIEFYRKNNLLELKTQMELTLSALAGYEEQIKNLRISESKAGENSSAAELQKRRYILEREFQKLRGGYTEDYTPSKNSIYINSDWAMQKILEQEQMENDLKRFIGVLEMLEMQIVVEEGNSVKNLPVIQIVQNAYIPDYKSKPKRAIYGFVGFVIAGFIVYGILILRGMLSGELECDKNTLATIKKLLNK